MDYLTDDTLSYLTESFLNYSNYKLLASFITCHRIKLITNKMLNDKLKRHYKYIIKDNCICNQLHTYNTIYAIYNNNFNLDFDKLRKLIIYSFEDNNMELFRILHKTIPNFVKSDHVQNELMPTFSNCLKNSILFNEKFEKIELINFYISPLSLSNCEIHIIILALNDLKEGNFHLITLSVFEILLRYYYVIITHYKNQLKILIQDREYRKYKAIITKFCLLNDDINILKLIIPKSNTDKLLARSIFDFKMGRIVRYIIENYIYDITSIINHLKSISYTSYSGYYTDEQIKSLLIKAGIKI